MRTRFLIALGFCLSLFSVTASVCGDEATFTFFATSDSHYEAIEEVERNDRNRVTIARMNELPGQSWPEKIGGGPIGKPLGILALGDLIDDGDKNGQTDIEWKHFSDQFGFDGTDGLLKYPVFEGWGNHDGPPEKYVKQRVSVQTEIKRRNAERLAKKLIARVSSNGLHYSWDWHGVHFIQTNLYPADKQNAKVRYSLPWHDPQDALAFVKQDLETTVGTSGRPVIVMAHCGFDTDWWVLDDWTAFYDAVKPYNVIAYLHGHSGTGVRKWMPAGADRPLDVVNMGQTEKGFFVVEISPTRMRVAYHVKRDPTVLEGVEWDWKYLFEKPRVPMKAPAARGPAAVTPDVRERFRLPDFYRQYVDADGLPVVASQHVPTSAVAEAAFLVDRMLDGRDDLRRAVAAAGVRVSVMAHDEFTTDVPEHADLQPAAHWNRRARGLQRATPTRPSVSCGTENLLGYPGDPYHGENILIHEFAHTIHQIGLAAVDTTFDDRLERAYRAAFDAGLWKGTYAATNRDEYWAEGVQSWFDCNRDRDDQHNGVRTREAVVDYDPPLGRLLIEVFGVDAWRYTGPERRSEMPHLAKLDRRKLPTFEWRAK